MQKIRNNFTFIHSIGKTETKLLHIVPESLFLKHVEKLCQKKTAEKTYSEF